MLRNYLKIAWRNLWRHKLYTTINVTGLALGLAVALLIGLFVWDEWNHDTFHDEGERIFRLIGHEEETGNLTAVMDGPLAPLLDEHLPQIERVARTARSALWIGEGDARTEEDVYFADSAFLEMFSFPMAVGNPATALDAPDAVVLSREAAQRIFGMENPVGQPLAIEFREETREMTVTGVLEAPPSSSSLQFDVLVPMAAYGHSAHEGEHYLTLRNLWVGDTFVQLTRGTPPEEAVALVNDVVGRHYADIETAYTSREAIEHYTLQPLGHMYFSPEVETRTVASSNPRYSYVLGGIAALVLLLACINFATLAIGRSSTRAREVGMRKTLGARPSQVRRQFWSEALMITVAALLMGFLLARLTLPVFNSLADRALTLEPLTAPLFLLFVVIGLLLVSLLASGYPAWVLSRFDPVAVLRGSTSGGRRKPGLISGLVVVQFALSIALLIGALVMAQQLNYVQQQELGFDREQVLAVENTSDVESDDLIPRIQQQLEARPEVLQVGGVSQVFGLSTPDFRLTSGDTLEVPIHRLSADENYREVLGIELKSGRDLYPASPPENPTRPWYPPALVNEALLDAMGWSQEEAIGRRLMLTTGNIRVTGGEVVGIVEDFHLRSLHHTVEPVIIPWEPHAARHVLIRIAPGTTADALQKVEVAWNEAALGAPFTYRFLDELVQAQYEEDRRWAAIVRYAVILALLISCFGLFGLSALAAHRRYREIGIRKVLGAPVRSIVALLSKDFALLVAIAFVIAAPIAYWVGSRWLETFAHHIDLGPDLFLFAGILAFSVALLTVSYHAFRAAWMNPTEAIKNE